MALILELRDARGTVTWHRLETLPLTLGRALSNDIIVDDPYTDAQHARISVDEAGDISIEDNGSVNGLRSNGSRANVRIIARPGVEVRMGRTILRFRDAHEAVPPALVESPPASLSWSRFETTSARRAIVALMFATLALVTWLGSTERSSAGSILAMLLAAGSATLFWSAVWAVAGRGIDRRFHLLGHMATVSLAILIGVAYHALNNWLTFFFPDSAIVSAAYVVVVLIVLAGLVAGHLSVMNALTRQRRWRAGFITAGITAVVIAIPGMLKMDEFSDVPRFEEQLKPVSPSLVPTSTVKEFLGAIGEAQKEADEAIEDEDGDKASAP